jgi:hypothetical protein
MRTIVASLPAVPHAIATTMEWLCLDSVTVRYMSGEQCSREAAREAEAEYRRFLLLALKYPDVSLVPSELVDAFWHYHILDTKKYYYDCQRMFGELLHHHPQVEPSPDVKSKYQTTLKLYRDEFGVVPASWGDAAACSCQSCDCIRH